MKGLILYFILLTVLLACSDSQISSDQIEAHIDSLTSETNTFDCDPPFSDTCQSSFIKLTEIVIEDTAVLVYSGAGWNKDYCSCTWGWGEVMFNEEPESANTKAFKIYLANLKSGQADFNKKYLESEEFKKLVILRYAHVQGEQYMKVIFDPFKMESIQNLNNGWNK